MRFVKNEEDEESIYKGAEVLTKVRYFLGLVSV